MFQVPSAEQVHIARLLSDSHTPDDIQERIAEVLTVVSEPEEAVLIALHDHDYNVHKTCEALLDSSSSIQVGRSICDVSHLVLCVAGPVDVHWSREEEQKKTDRHN